MLAFDASLLLNLSSSTTYRNGFTWAMGVFLLCDTNVCYRVGALQ